MVFGVAFRRLDTSKINKMNEFFDYLDGFVKTSQGIYDQLPHRGNNRWKYCVALAAKGWKASECVKVSEPDCDDIIVTWRKEGEEEIKLRLSFTEQCLWLEYMEQKEKQQ